MPREKFPKAYLLIACLLLYKTLLDDAPDN